MTNPSNHESEEPSGAREAPPSQPSYDDIALRAYFIALHRRSHGDEGDPLNDWMEAERQLRDERRREN